MYFQIIMLSWGFWGWDILQGQSPMFEHYGKRSSFQLLTDVVGLRSWRTKSDSFWLVLDEVVPLIWLFVLKWNSLGMVTASTLFSGSRSTMSVQKINAGEITWTVALRYPYKDLKRESSHIDTVLWCFIVNNKYSICALTPSKSCFVAGLILLTL